jgi:hypothetical protein
MSIHDYSEKQVKIIISGALNSFFVGNEKIVSADLYKTVLSRSGIFFRKMEAEDENGVYYIYEIVLSTEDIEHPSNRPYRSFYHEFKNYLTTGNMPDVDLLVRTSGEKRISGFMLYNMAYAELYFVKKHWPAFVGKDLDECIAEFQSRHRRFGK